MARQIDRLTAIGVRNLSEPGMYCDGGGLYLQIGPTGSKSWILRYTSPTEFDTTTGKAKKRHMGLGPINAIGLSDARQKAQVVRKQIADGTDPIEARERQKCALRLEAAKAKTFEACAEEYIAEFSKEWTNKKHDAQWRTTLKKYAYPVIGRLPIQSVDTALVLEILKPIWTEKTETAMRVRQRIEAVLDYAAVHGWREGENPARWKGHLKTLLPDPRKVKEVKHHPALPYAEVPDFMISLREQESVSGYGLQFLILTATRTREVIGATWQEIDLKGRLWTIAGDRMKARREHRIPLSDPATDILKYMWTIRQCGYVFPGQRAGKPLSDMAFLSLLKRMDRKDITAHGFRSTFRDWAAECTDHPPEVAEMALAHSVGNKVEQAYRRGDLFEKRRSIMDDWGEYCLSEACGEQLVGQEP